MRELLSTAECEQVRRCSYLDVASREEATTIYRVPYGMGLVRVYKGDQAVEDLCLQSTVPLPPGDLIVLHKLLIEADEREYLARANHFPVLPIPALSFEQILR